MEDIFLFSETFVREATNISDNVDSKYLLAAMREAQDVRLKHIIGTRLYNKLVRLVGAGTIKGAANAKYRTLLDEARYFLAYSAVTELVVKLAYKVTNMGVVKTTDEHVQAVSAQELAYNKDYYQSKADAHLLTLQKFLLAHSAEYPELGDNTCADIRANLYNTATCGIYLGGARGK